MNEQHIQTPMIIDGGDPNKQPMEKRDFVDLMGGIQQLISTMSPNNSLKDENVQLNKEIAGLRKEISGLNDMVKDLKEQLLKQSFMINNKNDAITKLNTQLPNLSVGKSYFSHTIVDQLVETDLQNPDINLGVVPDIIERKVRRDIYTSLLGSLVKAAETSSIHVLNHEIKINVCPITPTSSSTIKVSSEPKPSAGSTHKKSLSVSENNIIEKSLSISSENNIIEKTTTVDKSSSDASDAPKSISNIRRSVIE